MPSMSASTPITIAPTYTWLFLMARILSSDHCQLLEFPFDFSLPATSSSYEYYLPYLIVTGTRQECHFMTRRFRRVSGAAPYRLVRKWRPWIEGHSVRRCFR